MSFPDAVRSALSKYATFSGRSRRSEYWWFYLALIIVSIVAQVIDAAIGVSILGIIAFLALIVPILAVGVRRLHDTDRSGWWLLIGLIPLIGTIVLIVFSVMDSTPGANKYGPSPKQPQPQYG